MSDVKILKSTEQDYLAFVKGGVMPFYFEKADIPAIMEQLKELLE